MCLTTGAILHQHLCVGYVCSVSTPLYFEWLLHSWHPLISDSNFHWNPKERGNRGRAASKSNTLCAVVSKDNHCQSLPFWVWLGQRCQLCFLLCPFCCSTAVNHIFEGRWLLVKFTGLLLLQWSECAVRMSQDKGMFPELNFSVSKSILNKACNFRVWFWSLAMISLSLLLGSLEFTDSFLIHQPVLMWGMIHGSGKEN